MSTRPPAIPTAVAPAATAAPLMAPLTAPFWLEAGRLELLREALLPPLPPLLLLRLDDLLRPPDVLRRDVLRPPDALRPDVLRLAVLRLAVLRLAVLRLAVLRLVLRVPELLFLCPPDAFARPLDDFDALLEARVVLAPFERDPLDAARLRCAPPLDDVLLVAILTSPFENVLLVTTATQGVRKAIGVQDFYRATG